jgi:peptide/nickel transport system permease protein
LTEDIGMWQRFRQNPLGLAGLAIVVLMLMAATLIPLVVRQDPAAIDLQSVLKPPGTPGHILGVDDVGRDYLTRLAYGGRISLAVGLSVAGAGTVIGTLLGAVAGFYGGLADNLIARTIDVLLAVPMLPLLMIISGLRKVGPVELVLMMTFMGWMGVARLTRGQVLSLRETEFVLAARAMGGSGFHIVLRHLIPNVMAPVTVSATLRVAGAILTESGLSFLGFGVQPPTPTWGNMLLTAQTYLRRAPWMAVLPGSLIAATVIGFNFLGDGIRETLDPRLKGRL